MSRSLPIKGKTTYFLTMLLGKNENIITRSVAIQNVIVQLK